MHQGLVEKTSRGRPGFSPSGVPESWLSDTYQPLPQQNIDNEQNNCDILRHLHLANNEMQTYILGMTSPLPISHDELLDDFEDSLRKHPGSALRMIIWRMIYHELAASWTRNFLEEKGVFPKPTSETEKKNQLRKIDRTRQSLEKSVNLPVRAKKGATSDYKDSLIAWKRINPRPTKEELLAGWSPQPLPASSTQDDTAPSPATREPEHVKPAAPDLVNTSIPCEDPDIDEISGGTPKKRASVEMPPKYLPQEFLLKPPPPPTIPICGLDTTDTD